MKQVVEKQTKAMTEFVGHIKSLTASVNALISPNIQNLQEQIVPRSHYKTLHTGEIEAIAVRGKELMISKFDETELLQCNINGKGRQKLNATVMETIYTDFRMEFHLDPSFSFEGNLLAKMGEKVRQYRKTIKNKTKTASANVPTSGASQ